MTDTMELSHDQRAAVEAVRAWFEGAPRTVHCDVESPANGCPDWPHTHGHAQDYPVISVGGLAGTGKTTVLARLAAELGVKVAYGAPTHKAAHVLRRKLAPEDQENVRTYFSLVYHTRPYATCRRTGQFMPEVDTPLDCACGKPDSCECPRHYRRCFEVEGARDRSPHECQPEEQLKFERRSELGGHRDLVIVDEASMIPEARVRDICALGVPVLLIGDHGQLPPVKEDMNPWMLKPTVELTTNFRQTEESGIVAAALGVRDHGKLPLGTYGDGSTVVINLSNPHVGDVLDPGRFTPGPDRAIICWTNAMRTSINRRFHGDGPVRVGDRVISLDTSECLVVTGEGRPDLDEGWWYGDTFQVFNGMMGTVKAVIPVATVAGIGAPKVSGVTPAFRRSDKQAQLVVQLDDGPMVSTRVALEQLGRPDKLPPNLRPRAATCWDYAYGITCHKAQGSEYKHVIVIDQGRMPERNRWMYTAVTRAKEKLLVIQWTH